MEIIFIKLKKHSFSVSIHQLSIAIVKQRSLFNHYQYRIQWTECIFSSLNFVLGVSK